ncbi:hypothetical protein LNQ49_04815 [Flavobacterium sp. F-65]|uniref:Uncharacterized protein n=1 Tax=Flavobacterium pisciphilum TaxID=2893755 RepID=A0ABS8MQJ9_9FLAO|nr:hypothetical protein [Flavobacterium sp. F-65]MCC9070918.1 hypothetical protein [Flavobacterium sp. F-65]
MEIIYKSNVLNENWNNDIEKFDFFLLAVGTDLRAYKSIFVAEQNKIEVDNVVLFNFNEREDSIKKRKSIGSENYKNLSYKTKIYNCSLKNPSAALKLLDIDIPKDSQIAVDISFFTKPFFFTLLNWLKTVCEIENVTIFYTEPKNYVFNKGLYSEYHSSVGPVSIEEIASFSGNDANKNDSLLIIMLGFDGDLSAELDESVAPKKTILVNGFPSYSPNFKDISLISNEKVVNKGGNKLVFSRSTNPFDTYNLLTSIKDKTEYQDLFINIAPIGTKPMALGVCLFALHNPEIRIIYPVPEKFEDVTSHDSWCTWYYDISLNLNS